MEKKYICPKCGKSLQIDTFTNTLTCNRHFFPYEIPLAVHLLTPDLSFNLGKTKTNGNIKFYLNSKTKKFAITTEFNNSTQNNINNFGPYDINKLLEVKALHEDNIVYENKFNALPMIAGGALFGSFGAIAGSMISNQNTNVKKKHIYTLILKIEDINISSFCIETSDLDLIYKFVNSIEFLKPQTNLKG